MNIYKDLASPGFNAATISTFGSMIFILLSAYGQYVQGKKIYAAKKAEHVSHPVIITVATLFGAYLIRGIIESKMMFLFQGILRICLVIPIIVGIIRWSEFTKKDKMLATTSVAFLTIMCINSTFRQIGFSLVCIATAVTAFKQAWELYVAKKNGQVSLIFYLTMFGSVALQTWYGFHFKDWSLLVGCFFCSSAHLSVALVWIRNWYKQKAASQ